jgi:ABC-type lipoprotein release transport system permease subunit
VFASTGVIRNMLYGADSTDVPTIIAGVAGLIALAGLASLFPAYRAASVSPASALRGE